MKKNPERWVLPWCTLKKGLRMIKWSLFFFCLGIMQVLANNTYSQQTRFSMKFENAKLENILNEIENQSEYYFLYNQDYVDVKQVVSFQTNDMKIDEVLNVLLEPTNIKYSIYNRQIVLTVRENNGVLANDQLKITISGLVTDLAGAPLPGVSIVVKGTTTGTITDFEGRYMLPNVPEKAILVYSFVGMKTQEIPASGKSVIDVKLEEDAIGIEEVVAVGYGTQKKVNLTGAVSQITAEALQDRPVTELTKALQGAIPNLNITFGNGKPGNSGILNVRGNTSINGGEPLVLIDGIPGDMDKINMNDVKSISVLKDASASAVYGARAAFGVILVTTKNPVKGKTKIVYSANYGWTTHASNTNYLTTGYDQMKFVDESHYNTFGRTLSGYTDAMKLELYKRRNDRTENPNRPWVVVEQDNTGQDVYRYYGNFDWFNYFYAKYRPKQEHNISISGASEKTRYIISGAFAKERGLFNINPDQFKRYNMRTRVETDIKPWLTVSNNTHFFKSNYTWYGAANNLPPTKDNSVSSSPAYQYLAAYVPKNPDGTLTHRTGLNSYTMGYGMHNFLEDGMGGEEGKLEFKTTFEAVLKPFEGVSITANYTYGYSNKSWNYRRFKSYYSLYPGKVELGTTSGMNRDTFQEDFSQNFYNGVNVVGNYKKDFGNHSTNFMIGFNQEVERYKYVSLWGTDLLSKTLNDMKLVSGEETNSGDAYEWAVRGAFARINYAYMGKYLFELSGRYDATSLFPKANRFDFFPSFSVGWRISEEDFFNPLKSIVSNLKVRYSYGMLGNQRVVDPSTKERVYYPYIPSIEAGTISYLENGSKLNVTKQPKPISSNLTWEKSITNNIGLDVDLWNDHLSFSGDYYIRDTEDMLTQGKELPSVFGAGEPIENAANLRTNGFELIITYRNKINLSPKPLNYSITGNLSDYTAKITKFDNPSKALNNYYVGKQLGDIWGYSYDGFFKTNEEAQEWASIVDQNLINVRRVQAVPSDMKALQAGDIKILDLDGNGKINSGLNTVDDPGDRRIIGNVQPRYSFGLKLSADWNGFDFSIFFQGIGKRNWYPNRDAVGFWGCYSRSYVSFLPENFEDLVWSETNPNSYFPKLRSYIAQNAELYYANDMYMQDLAYCKLRNLTIGYNLHKRILDKLDIDKVRFYVSGDNLHTWTKFETDYMDPEEVMIDPTGRTYMMGKVFSVGVQVGF